MVHYFDEERVALGRIIVLRDEGDKDCALILLTCFAAVG